MDTTFLIEVDEKTKIPYSEAIPLLEVLDFKHWMYNENTNILFAHSNRDIIYQSFIDCVKDYRKPIKTKADGITPDLSGIIPVGSINFSNYIMEKQANKHIKPINIPSCLRAEEFTHRFVADISTKAEYIKYLNTYEKLLVKPNDEIKRFEITLIRDIDSIKDNVNWFISSLVNFQDEWRVFVYKGNIQHIARYIQVDYHNNLDIDFVYKCIKTYHESGEDSPAYTLDIGILDNGQPAIIEVHNFISCGLYGFDGEYLTNMYKDAWVYELTH